MLAIDPASLCTLAELRQLCASWNMPPSSPGLRRTRQREPHAQNFRRTHGIFPPNNSRPTCHTPTLPRCVSPSSLPMRRYQEDGRLAARTALTLEPFSAERRFEQQHSSGRHLRVSSIPARVARESADGTARTHKPPLNTWTPRLPRKRTHVPLNPPKLAGAFEALAAE